MADALAVSLLALSAKTADGDGATVDIRPNGEPRTTLDLVVCADAVSGTDTPTLVVSVETALSTSGPWREVGALSPVTAVGMHKFRVGDCLQYVRASWVITGTTPSFTFSVAGNAHTVYADRSDLEDYAMSVNVLTDVDPQKLLVAVLAGTAEAESFLDNAYEMPITAWGSDLRKHTATLAVHTIAMHTREGLDETLDVAKDAAIRWFEMIGTGRIRPGTIIDTSPEIDESTAAVVTTTSRGWV